MRYLLLVLLVTFAVAEEAPLVKVFDEILVVPTKPGASRGLSKYGRTRLFNGYEALVKVSIPRASEKEIERIIKEMYENKEIVGMTYVYKQESTRVYHSPFVVVMWLELDSMKDAYEDKIHGIKLISADPTHEGLIFAYDERSHRLWERKALLRLCKEIKGGLAHVLSLREEAK